MPAEFQTQVRATVRRAALFLIPGVLILALALYLAVRKVWAAPAHTAISATAYARSAVQCRGTTLSGTRCANRTTSGDYCYRHRAQARH